MTVQMGNAARWAALLAAGIALAGSAAFAAAEPVLRVRAVSVKPALYVRVFHPLGNGAWGELTRERPAAPVAPGGLPDAGLEEKPDAGDVTALLKDEPAEPDRIVEEGQTDNHLWLKAGTWSPAVPLNDFQGFVTFRVDGLNGKTRKPAAVESVTLEFEVSLGGKVLKTFAEASGAGNRVTARFSAAPPGSSAFAEETQGLLDYARKRADRLEALPWAKDRLPTNYVLLSACSGWGTQTGDPAVYLAEYRSMRQLGVNGMFYNTWPGLRDLVVKREGIGAEFARAQGENQNTRLTRFPAQYLLPGFDPNQPRPGDGCPAHPVHAGFATNVAAGVEEMMALLRGEPYGEWWFQTVSEIGSFFDQSPEGKAHQGVCPYCREDFRAFLKSFGLTPADFGVADWEPVRSTFGYSALSWEEQQKAAGKLRAEQEARRKKEMEENSTLVIDRADEEAVPDLEKAKAGSGKPAGCPLSDAGWARLRYYSARYNNEASARIYGPLRDALRAQNDRKRKALAEGRTAAPEAAQPWVYSFALRGNTFLMGGHSLDFFDWYRHADNAFMYETSNRDPRTWQWDSYLCDVGRIHQEKLGTRFSLMVKPSRGAVVQRTLSAAARGVKAIYWYTYGPDWHHPDTFARAPERLDKVSRVAHMLGEAEEALYGAVPERPAGVAVVRPFTSAVFDNSASWENGKWVFTALSQSGIPVDPLDEGYLLTEALSRYKVIVVSGSHVRKDAAEKLARWVEAGGTLITTAGGLARDEADQPLAVLQPVLGLKGRTPVELWREVKRYGASALADLPAASPVPSAEAVGFQADGLLAGAGYSLMVGREVLAPEAGAQVWGHYGDGGAAVVRNAFGKGSAVTIGLYAGLEYAADLMRPDFDMPGQLKAMKRLVLAAPVLAAGVEPPVRVSSPMVEAALMRHPANGRESLVLMNWGYRGSELVPQKDLVVAWESAGNPTRVKSLWLRQWFPVTREGELCKVVLPVVEEGDVLVE